jgi:glucokinase
VLSGLPGSGKTTLGRQLAASLNLPLLDKDAILETLFESEGIGGQEWRRRLIRKSDVILQAQAGASEGAILISFWHLPGMPSDSGTPTDWLFALPGYVVNVHCACPSETAAARLVQRRRHRGHLDSERSYSDFLASLQAIEGLDRLGIDERIDVDTSQPIKLETVIQDVQHAFARCAARAQRG